MEDWRDALWQIVSVVIVLGIAVALYRHFTAPKPATLEQQRVCAAQVAKVATDRAAGFYTANFNTMIGRCFALIETSGGDGSKGERSIDAHLMDAFTNEQIGNFFDYIGPPPAKETLTCSILVDGSLKRCASESEWDKWTAEYMQPMDRE